MGRKPSAPDDYGLIELAENRKYAQKYPEWAFVCGLTEYQARHMFPREITYDYVRSIVANFE